VWNGGNSNERALLESCYRNALRLTLEAGHTSIAFPAISTGVYRFPFDEGTRIALRVVNEALIANESLSVTLCFFAERDLARARELAEMNRAPKPEP